MTTLYILSWLPAGALGVFLWRLTAWWVERVPLPSLRRLTWGHVTAFAFGWFGLAASVLGIAGVATCIAVASIPMRRRVFGGDEK